MRIDRAISRPAAFFGSAYTKGKRLDPSDFSPYDQEVNQSEGTIDDAMALLNGLVKDK